MAAEVGIKGTTRSVSSIWWKVPLWLMLIITTVISLFPMYWLFLTAFTPTREIIKTPPDILPLNPSLDNFQRLFEQAKFYGNWALNSFIITLSITAFHVVFDTLAGYAFA